jgi:hypothetical protein
LKKYTDMPGTRTSKPAGDSKYGGQMNPGITRSAYIITIRAKILSVRSFSILIEA